MSVMTFALTRPIPLFALAAVASVVAALCIGAFPVGMPELLAAVGFGDRPLDDTTVGDAFAELARALRVNELRDGALARADALFHSDRKPWCPELF